MAEPPTILDPDWMDERHREMNERIVGAKAPGQSPPDLSVSAFTMSAHRLVIEPAPSKWDEDSNPQEMERRPRRNDNDLLVTLPGKRGPPADDREPLFGSGPLSLTRNFKIKEGDFNFESDRVRDPDGDPHFLIELQARSIPQDPESQPPGQLITTRVFRLRIQNLDEYAPSFEEQPWQAESHTKVIAADAETSFAVKAIDRDRFDTVRYELAEATSDNDNHLVSFDYGSCSIRFAAGMFDFEQALRSEDGRRYFLIEIAAISDATGSVHELTHKTRSFRIWIADADDTPTGLQLSNTLASLAETADVSSRTKVADLDVSDADSDAAFLRHSFTLSGRHRELFEVAGGALYLKAGTLLDHETAPRLEVTVSLDGTTFAADYRLAIDDRPDESITVDALPGLSVSENSPDHFSDSSFIIGFHLSADGGHSWSRLIYYYSDTNMRAVTYVFREYTNQIGNPRADNELGYLYGQHEFFDNDVGSLGETLGEPGVNHIWGYGESEKLWFGGSRKLSFGNLNTVYFKMRDVGGDPASGIRSCSITIEPSMDRARTCWPCSMIIQLTKVILPPV